MTVARECQPDTAHLARRAAMFREGTRRLFEDEGAAKGDLWFFELWYFLGDVESALSLEGAKSYVDLAIASYVGDPPDNEFQKGYLAALEVVRDEAFPTIPSVPQEKRP